jgi:hypothetical protein
LIELTRALARQFRTVLRRSLLEQEPRPSCPLVQCRAGDDGLTLQARCIDMALRYHQSGKRPADAIAFPATVLAEFEGRAESPVVLEQVAAGKGRARWDDGGVPRSLDFETASDQKDAAAFPETPTSLVPMPEGFLQALEEATRTAAKLSTRYALSRLRLRGQRGELVATDGSQLLVQGGFPFPWTEDLLIPRASAFGCREFAGSGLVAVGRTKSHVAVQSGPWTLLLTVDATGRYPDVDAVIPKTHGAVRRLRLDARDAALLTASLPRLPGRGDFNAPVTLDLATPPAVRARDEGCEQVTELSLDRSTVTGPPVRLCTNGGFLLRAVKLGFTELQIFAADQPILCRDDRRLFLWVPLDKKTAIPPGANVLRIAPAAPVGAAGLSLLLKKKEHPFMPSPTNGHKPANGNGHGRDDHGGRDPQPERWGIEEVIAETEALRGVLQDASSRTARLLAALKGQRRQSRAVRAAVVSLQQLKLDA